MPSTAVDILGNKNVLVRAEICKISEKWWKRTARSNTKWPKEGTFDAVVCEEMEVLVKNYRPNDKGKKALAKRERERIVMAMFKKEGELFRLTERKARDIISGDKAVEVGKTEPPPCNTGLYPVVTGTIDIVGEVKIEGSRKDSEAKKGAEASIHMDCYRQFTEGERERYRTE